LERRARARIQETLSRLIEVELSRELRERLDAIEETGGGEHGKETRGRVKRGESVRHWRRSERT
jgi:hypothetical protein